MKRYTFDTLNKIEQFVSWLTLYRKDVQILKVGLTGVVTDSGDAIPDQESYLLDLPISDAHTVIWSAEQEGFYGIYHAALLRFYENPSKRFYLTASDEERINALVKMTEQLARKNIRNDLLVIEPSDTRIEGVEEVLHIKFKKGAKVDG